MFVCFFFCFLFFVFCFLFFVLFCFVLFCFFLIFVFVFANMVKQISAAGCIFLDEGTISWPLL